VQVNLLVCVVLCNLAASNIKGHKDWAKIRRAKFISWGFRCSKLIVYKFLTLQNICKSWDFHGGDYEECLLLGYKSRVHTSLERHCVSVTEPSRLMLCKIRRFHCDEYDEWAFLGHAEVWLL
jgi:hypothetical protein